MTTTSRWRARCADDGEFQLTSRYWTGALQFDLGPETVTLELRDGLLVDPPDPSADDGIQSMRGAVVIQAPDDVWDRILAEIPPPQYNDIIAAQKFGLRIRGDSETFWQYYPAIRRAVEILRDVRLEAAV